MAESGSTFAAEVAEATLRYRLRLDGRRFRGRIGSRRGSAPGSSLEFLDFRDYVPGDDLRHVDWQGFARSDQLRVRLQEEEVAPFVDVLVDGSASMASTPAKARATRALLAAIEHWARREGATPRLLELGGGLAEAASLQFAGNAATPAMPIVPLRSGAVRVLVTDGLWQQEPRPVLLRLAAGTARFLCLQLLDPWEIEPALGEAVTLHDCETGERLEVRLDRRQIDDYQARLARLCDGLRGAVLAGGGHAGVGHYARVVADSLPRMCARDLLPSGIVVPA